MFGIARKSSAARRISIVALLGAGLALLGAAAPAHAADPVGCGYGTNGPYADTLCWIDMSGYVDATARAGGQAMSVTLPGGYTASFVVVTSGAGQIAHEAFPTWAYGATVGVDIYVGTPGRPALYQTGSNTSPTTISLTDIEVEDSEGNTVHDWRFVGVDAEATANSESITFTSDVPVSPLATFATAGATNGCQFAVTQIDANTVSCTGGPTGDDYGTVLVSAIEPGTFTQTMIRNAPAARQAVAFAFQSSKIELNATVGTRSKPSDSFTVAVTSPESATIGASSTSTGSTASTGPLDVLPLVGGSAYTLTATPSATTTSTEYTYNWTCTRNGVADASLSKTGVTSIQVSPEPGDFVDCTVAISRALAATGLTALPNIAVLGTGMLALGATVALLALRRRARA